MDLDLAYVAAAALNEEQAAVIRYLVVHELTERETAALLSEIRGMSYSRDRVHRILLTSLARMRRTIEAHLAEERAA